MTTSPEHVEKFAEFAAATTFRRSITSEDWTTDIVPAHTLFVTDPHGTEGEQDFIERVRAYMEHVRSASKTIDLDFPVLGSTSDLGGEEEPIRTHESPFERLFYLQSNDDRVKDLVEFADDSLDLPYSHRLMRRLRNLQEGAIEEAPNHASMSSGSLQSFVSFLSDSPKNMKYPEVTLTPNGNIYINWHGQNRKNFAIEFLPSELSHHNTARFVIFYPKSSDPTSMIRLSGTAPTSSLIEIAESHGALAWILE